MHIYCFKSNHQTKMGFLCFNKVTCNGNGKEVPKVAKTVLQKAQRTCGGFFSKNLRDNKLDLVYVSSSAVVYRGVHEPTNKSAIFKLFYSDRKCNNLARTELEAYRHLAEHNITEGVPKMYDYWVGPSGNVCMCLQDLGYDAYDMTLNKLENGPIWTKGVVDLSLLLNQMHTSRFIHGDIKLENMAYSDGSWYLFDFGFFKVEPGARVSGTIPQIPPSIAHRHMCQLTFEERRSIDYYAFAVTMLTCLDLPLIERCPKCINSPRRCKSFKCSSKSYLIIDIETLYTKCVGKSLIEIPPDKAHWGSYNPFMDNPTWILIYKCLCAMILSELDCKYKTLIWDQSGYAYSYADVNLHFAPDVKFGPIDEYWAELLTYVNTLKSKE